MRRLKRLYEAATWAEIERAFPDRTRDSIQLKAARLGLKRAKFSDATEEVRLIEALTNEQAAYIAGLVDGEGSIMWNPRAGLFFTMGLTNESAIQYLATTVGGSARAVAVKQGRRPLWRWTLSKERATTALLKRLRPYLIIKRDHPLRRAE